MQIHMKSIIFLNFLMLQKQVTILKITKMEDKIILYIFSICNTSFNKIQSNISSDNSRMSNY